jgi:hypothetical protein
VDLSPFTTMAFGPQRRISLGIIFLHFKVLLIDVQYDDSGKAQYIPVDPSLTNTINLPDINSMLQPN